MNDKQNIIIIGMPGCGKSTFGKALARKLGRPFYDADDVIVQQEGKTIPELFAISEDCFRDAEVRASRFLADKKGIVVACGGGVIKRPENISIFKKTGTVFFLDRSPDDIVSDVDVSVRPLLKDGRQKVYNLYKERIGLYRDAADYCIDNNKDIEDVLDEFEILIGNIR
jgi:shikimate kinase